MQFTESLILSLHSLSAPIVLFDALQIVHWFRFRWPRILYKSCACAPSTSSSNVSLSLSALIPSSSSFHTALVCESVAQNKRYKSGDGDNVWQPLFFAVSVDFSSGFFPQIPNSAQLLEVSKRGGNRRKYHYDSFIISKKPRNYHHIQHIS